MIHIPIKKLKEGMITAQSIYNPLGANYLTKGMELSPKYIERLEKAGQKIWTGRRHCHVSRSQTQASTAC